MSLVDFLILYFKLDMQEKRGRFYFSERGLFTNPLAQIGATESKNRTVPFFAGHGKLGHDPFLRKWDRVPQIFRVPIFLLCPTQKSGDTIPISENRVMSPDFSGLVTNSFLTALPTRHHPSR
jgi:hypothetical protein